MSFGPVGALAGGVLGATGSLLGSREEEKAREAARPKRRRLASALEQMEAQKAKKRGAMAALSQAAFDWAAALR
jgi:hypothetical protein